MGWVGLGEEKWTHVHLLGCRAQWLVSGTTVRALIQGRFSQKKLKIELKDNAKNE